MRFLLRLALAAVLLLGGADRAVAEPEAAHDMPETEVVRLAVMLDQIAALLHRAAAVAPDAPKNDQEMRESLNAVVQRFNRLLPLACAHYRIADCSAYHPAWLGRADANISAAVDDTYARVTPVWTAVCAGRKTRCPIE